MDVWDNEGDWTDAEVYDYERILFFDFIYFVSDYKISLQMVFIMD